jgi:hypothetical protein
MMYTDFISSGKSTARSVTLDIGNGVGVEMTTGNLVSSGRGVTVGGLVEGFAQPAYTFDPRLPLLHDLGFTGY